MTCILLRWQDDGLDAFELDLRVRIENPLPPLPPHPCHQAYLTSEPRQRYLSGRLGVSQQKGEQKLTPAELCLCSHLSLLSSFFQIVFLCQLEDYMCNIEKSVTFIWEEVGMSILGVLTGPFTCTFWTVSLVEESIEKQFDLSELWTLFCGDTDPRSFTKSKM